VKYIRLPAVLLIFMVATQLVFAQDNGLKVGDEAPTFSLPDMNLKYVSLRDFSGAKLRKPWKNKTKHVVVISFFATWCKPCMKEIPHLQNVRDSFDDQPVKFFLIDVGEDQKKVSTFLRNKDINIPVLLDRYQKTAEKYDALTLPRLFVVDKNGVVRKEQKGFANPAHFESEMKALITGLLSE
jgi:peroxiredoxin